MLPTTAAQPAATPMPGPESPSRVSEHGVPLGPAAAEQRSAIAPVLAVAVVLPAAALTLGGVLIAIAGSSIDGRLPAGMRAAASSTQGRFWAAAVATTAAYLVLLAMLVLTTRPRHVHAGPAGIDLGDEPVAIAALLVNRWALPADAVPATLLDLAARGWLSVDEGAPGTTLVRLRNAGHGELQPYEQRVLDHVRAVAVGGVVPSLALTAGPTASARAWWNGFRREVLSDAGERGLSRARWSRPVLLVLALAALVPAGFVALAILAADPPSNSTNGSSNNNSGGFLGLALFAWFGLVSLTALFRDQRDTPQGREVAARWLGLRRYLAGDAAFPDLPPAAVGLWDRYLAAGAAMGIAVATLRALPMGAEDDHRAWSSEGNRWRPVRVRYGRVFDRAWGAAPLGTALRGLVFGAAGVGMRWLSGQVSGVSAQDAARLPNAGPWRLVDVLTSGLSVAGVLLLALGLLRVIRGGVDLVSSVTVEGTVLRVRPRDPESTWIACDDGRLPRITAWAAVAGRLGGAREGDRIRATVTPRLRHVRRVERLQRAPVAVEQDDAVEIAAPPAAILTRLAGRSDRP